MLTICSSNLLPEPKSPTFSTNGFWSRLTLSTSKRPPLPPALLLLLPHIHYKGTQDLSQPTISFFSHSSRSLHAAQSEHWEKAVVRLYVEGAAQFKC